MSHKVPTSEVAPLLSSLTGGGHVAYFSMEIALDSQLPTYSGGLGVLAGDTLRAAADLAVPMVAVTLLYHKGYFKQAINHGQQAEEPVLWNPSKFLEPTGAFAEVMVEGRKVKLTAHRYLIKGAGGAVLPVFFMDTNLDGNDAWDRTLTDSLYAGDERYRLAQETVLGMGGVAILKALGFHALGSSNAPSGSKPIARYHMNEGHAALLTLALVAERTGGKIPADLSPADHAWVQEHCVFTTHTPVPAGHDRFPLSLVAETLGRDACAALEKWHTVEGGSLNMTLLAMNFARYINGVAKRHGEVSRDMFKGSVQTKTRKIVAITNGVHGESWIGKPMQALFDEEIPEWRLDNAYLRYMRDVAPAKIVASHAEAKAHMIAQVKERTGVVLDAKTFTIGFARRAAEYKRADLLFSDLKRLETVARTAGPIQVVFAGKAHPKDLGGKKLIANVNAAAGQLDAKLVKVVYVPNYDMELGLILTSGVDLWLNTPLKPLEASGTSGMKAAMNGVPSFSTLDGWWVEGCFEGITGWEIDDDKVADPAERPTSVSAVASASIYGKLEQTILPLYYKNKGGWADVMRGSISINGSFFSTHRMVQQYLWFAYK